MTVLGGIGFGAPWLLVALAGLPILWLILRPVPPAPIKRRFPGVALLLGLQDDETVSDRTPWWLMLLRMLAVAAIIIGLAQPVLNPDEPSQTTTGPALIVLDGSWAGAAGHARRMEAVDSALARLAAAGETAAVLQLSDPEPLLFLPASTWATRLAGLQPQPWQPSEANIETAAGIIADILTMAG